MELHLARLETLHEILAAELEGRHFDRYRAQELASELAEAFPVIADSLNRIAARMAPPVLARSA